MSVHTEWDLAATCDVTVLTAAATRDTLHPDDDIHAPYVLVLGGTSGGCLALEGDPADLCQLAARISAAAAAAQHHATTA